MSVTLVIDRKFRTLNIIDDCNRSIGFRDRNVLVLKTSNRTLEQVIDWRGKPNIVRVDNSPEHTSKDFE